MDLQTGVPALDTALMWGGAITLLGGVGAVLWRAIRAVSTFGGRTTQFFDDWYGEGSRPGVPSRPGVMERLGALEDHIRGVQHEMKPNSGASLRDAVDRANERLAKLCPDPRQPDCGDCGQPAQDEAEKPPADPAP